jgi:hypothetical protein
MAAIAASLVTKRGDDVVHSNGYVDRSFQVTIINPSAEDEWVVTGLSKIVAVVGWAATAYGSTPVFYTNPPLFLLNSEGTAAGATDTPGCLGIEVSDAWSIFSVTVRGIA